MSTSIRRLPPQPNLEQLRKQAKELLEEYCAGEPDAIATVQEFEWHPDPATFALNEAQRVVARSYGFQSWPKLKAFVDGVNVRRLAEAVQSGDQAQVRVMLNARPELIEMDMSGGDERRALHFAVLRRDVSMVKLLMEAGADARKGVYPHREATTAYGIARDRGYDDVLAVIEEEERHRREDMSCPNATISPVQDQITAAIRSGDIAGAIHLLDADKSLIQACDRNGRTPLHIAAAQMSTELVAWLLDRRAKVDKQDVAGLTALDWAVLRTHPQTGNTSRFPVVARQLIERGAEVTIRSAVALGNAQRVRQLIAEDPALLRVTQPVGGLLTIAVNHNRLDMAQLLLDLGADVDERELLQELEEATVSWGGPLWHAALAGNLRMTELLLDRGADPNANVYASGWPLRNAWHHQDDSVKRLLLARGAKIPTFMVAELHDVAEAKRLLAADPSEQIVRELLEAAADGGCAEIVELALPRLQWPRNDNEWRWYLIQPIRGIGKDQPDHEGHFRCMDLLLRHGIDPNIRAFGQTALHFTAAWHGDVSGPERARFAAMLLDYGARLDVRDEMLQSTPLAWACRWGQKEMVEVLIARGAPVEEPDAERWATPMAWAEKMKQNEVLKLLNSV